MNTKPRAVWRTGLAWGMYDFANSGYYLVYALLVLPLYLATVALKDDRLFEVKWGVAQGAAVVLAVLAGLLLGRKLDRFRPGAAARVAMVLPAVASLAFPFLVALHATGDVLLVCYVIVHALYLLSLTIYDASLAHVVRPTEFVETSGWAWGFGYAGGLTCLALMEVGLMFWPRYSPWDFAVGSLFFLVFAAIASRRLRRLIMPASDTDSAPLNVQEPAAVTTLPPTKMSRWRLLGIFILIIDGIAIFMAFFAIFASKFANIGEREITAMLAVLQLLAFPLTGIVSSTARYGVPRLVFVCGAVWAVAAGIVLAAPGRVSMWVAVLLMAAVVGTTQAIVRAIYAATVQKREAIRGFGVYAIVEKGAAFLGPALAGVFIVTLGQRAVMAIAGALIFIGCALLARFIWKNKVTDGGAT